MTSDPHEVAAPASLPPRQYPYAPESNVASKRSLGATVAIVVACVFVVLGLVMVAGFVLFILALNSYGSNK